MASKAKRVRKASERASKPREIGVDRAQAKAAAKVAAEASAGGAGAKAAAVAAGTGEPPERDGLIWLSTGRRNKRLSPEKSREGLRYRDLFRVADPGAAIASSIESLGMAGGRGRGSPVSLGGSFEDAGAKLELWVVRWLVLQGHEEMIMVMDAVCGQGWTLRYLAAGDHHRAAELEKSLNIALDLMVLNTRAKRAAKKAA